MGEEARRRDLTEALGHRVGHLVDRRLGIDTGGVIGEHELGLDPSKSAGYDASRWLALRTLLPRRSLSPRDVFVDLGSGKGRVVLQAARYYRFKRVIGVEISTGLHRIAQANLEVMRGRLRSPVELRNADVLDWVPPGDLTIVWMFNPFRAEVFSAVMLRLVDLVRRRDESLRVIYLHPAEDGRVMATRHAVRVAAPSAFRLRLAGIPVDWVKCYELRPSP